jgi:protein PhnA
MSLPPCPHCHSAYTYEDRELLICPECSHEWRLESGEKILEQIASVKDANGNLLFEGDGATLIKDLKVKGSSNVLKIGTKVKINRIVEGDHNIDCRIDKAGEMMLKSEFVKKITN